MLVSAHANVAVLRTVRGLRADETFLSMWLNEMVLFTYK